MENQRNYYRILHTQPDAPMEVIKASYRTLMQKLKQHPDLGGEHWNAALINEAYNLLRDSDKRRLYDQSLLESLLEKHSDKKVESHTDDFHEEQRIRAYCNFCKTPHTDFTTPEHELFCLECDSPLNPPEVTGKCEDHEAQMQRAFERMEKEGVIHYYFFWPQQHKVGHIRDLSPNGMCFYATDRPLEDQIIKIQSPLLQATARVVNCRLTNENSAFPFSVGIEFLAVSFDRQQGNFLSISV